MQEDAQVRGTGPGAAAPGRLELVREFVNTRDIEAGTDELDTAPGLDRWLGGRDLVPGGGAGLAATQADLARARALREALRAVLRGHAGREHGTGGAVAALAAGMKTRLAVTEDGQLLVVPDGAGVGAALAAILIAAGEAATLGTWTRLKVCGADDCQWAFYDRSPTRSGCWCSMQICGSRAKSRAYRSRAAGTG